VVGKDSRGSRPPLGTAVLAVVLLLAGGLTMWEFWPESTVVSGDCERAVACPPMTIENGSAAWTVLGALLLLVGLALVAVIVLRSASGRAASRPGSVTREQSGTGGGHVS
jgi:hypothetical protein